LTELTTLFRGIKCHLLVIMIYRLSITHCFTSRILHILKTHHYSLHLNRTLN